MSGIGPRPFKRQEETRTRSKTIATIVVHRAADMTPAGRKEIADWLRRQVAFIETEGEKCSSRFTARYCAR